jgi:hypothetical protein
VAAIALLFGAYLLAGFYLAPRLIRDQATQWVKLNLNKPLAIGEIKVNPLSFKVDISDIAIPGPDRPMVALGHLRLGFSLLSLFQDAWRLTELRFDQPFVQTTIRPDGSLNLLELVPPSKGGETPAVRIDVLSVNQGRIAYADDSRTPRVQERLEPITFTLKDFHTKKNEGGEFTLDGASQSNERFAWRGTVSMAPIASQGRFTITDLQAATIAKFLGDRLPVALQAGRIGLDGSYGFGYGPGGLKLNMSIPRLALRGLAFDGRDVLFHGAAEADDVLASISFASATNARGPAAVTAAMPHLVLKGITLSGTGPAKGQVIRLANAALDGLKLDASGRRVELGAISLAGLDMPLAREKNGGISVSRWLPAQPQGTAPEAAGAAAPPWTLALAKFALTDAAVHLTDRAVTPAARFDLTDIAVTAANAGTDLSRPVDLQLSAVINGKGRFKADGAVTPQTRAADIQFDLQNMPLRPAAAYLQHPALELRSGELGVSGTLNLSGGEKSALRFKGDAAVSNFGLYERSGNSLLFSWRSFKLTGIDYKPGQVEIAGARLSRPVGGVAILADRSFNFTSALMSQAAASQAPASQAPASQASGPQLPAPQASPQIPVSQVAVPATPPAGKAPALALRLKNLDIDGGTMSFADRSIEPNFEARIEALQGRIKNISTAPDAIAAIDLKGQVIDRFSPVTIAGTANLLGYDRNTDIQVAFRNIELPIFNPYSGRYAGYAIAKGKLTTEMHYKVVNRALQADHHVIIDQLEWGQASDSKDRVPWPVGLVTSLLKDRHGVIDLSLPVRGSLDDPTFRIGPIIWQIIGNLVEKIVTAPFALIGSLFEGAEKAQYVDFAPGSSAMPVGAADSLAALAKGLGDRPALQLDIPAAPAPKEDAIFLADSRIDALLMADEIKKGRPADFSALDGDEQHDRLEDLYRAKVGKRPAFPETLPPLDAKPAAAGQPPPDADQQRQKQEIVWMRGELRNALLPSNPELAALGSARATAVRDALLAKGDIDPARVFLVTGQTANASNGHVRLELKLR